MDARAEEVIEPVHGLYYERREMSAKVSPIVVDDKSDLATLKSIFLGYYLSAESKDATIASNLAIQKIKSHFKDNRAIDIKHDLIKSVLSHQSLTTEKAIEEFIASRFFAASEPG